jgi:hypothetical protein
MLFFDLLSVLYHDAVKPAHLSFLNCKKIYFSSFYIYEVTECYER